MYNVGLNILQHVYVLNIPALSTSQFVLSGSDRKAVLHVSELVQGTYTFVLRVTNVRGKSTEDEAVVTVLPDPLTSNLVSSVYNLPTIYLMGNEIELG